MKKRETARLLLDGWLVYYNFFRPHESLKGMTPAEKAGIKFSYKNWADVVRGQKKETQVTDDGIIKTYRVRAYPVYEKPKRNRKAEHKRAGQETEVTLSTMRLK